MLVSGALDDTKKMRKAGAHIFAKSGPEKNPKKQKNLNILRDFHSFSRGLSLKPVNSRTNGWEPYFLRKRHFLCHFWALPWGYGWLGAIHTGQEATITLHYRLPMTKFRNLVLCSSRSNLVVQRSRYH